MSCKWSCSCSAKLKATHSSNSHVIHTWSMTSGAIQQGVPTNVFLGFLFEAPFPPTRGCESNSQLLTPKSETKHTDQLNQNQNNNCKVDAAFAAKLRHKGVCNPPFLILKVRHPVLGLGFYWGGRGARSGQEQEWQEWQYPNSNS